MGDPRKGTSDDVANVAADLARRQRHGRAPQRLSDIISQLMARRGYARVQASAQLDSLWKRVVGEPLASQTRAGRLRRGVLEVTVANPTLVQELTFQKQHLCKQLNQQDMAGRIRDLRFRVGVVQ